MSNSTANTFPKRVRYILYTGLIIFFSGYFLVVLIEKMTAVEAFYFLVVTVSTVGYGDVTPENTIARIIVSIMIITGISSIAIVSERLIDRIIRISTQQYLELPTTPLDYLDHIIIVGFTKIAENVAMLFQGRFFRVVVLDPHTIAVDRARNYGFEAYFGNPVLKQVLVQANISQAAALYLFMNDENKNVLTSIQARSLSPNILIFAETDHELSIEIGQLVGIDRTYHYERIIASNISFSLRSISALVLPNQTLSDVSNFIMLVVSNRYPYEEKFEEYYPLGFVHRTFTGFIPISESSIQEELTKDNLLLIAVPIEEFNRADDGSLSPDMLIIEEGPSSITNIIVGGYNDVAHHVLQETDDVLITDMDVNILCFSEEEAKKAIEDGFAVIRCKRENVSEKLNEVCKSDTLIINLFDKITDSLLVNTAAKKVDAEITILQIARDRVENDVLVKSGADRILIPELLMSRGMFLIYLSTKYLVNSIVWANSHIFEHYVSKEDPLIGLNYKNLNKRGYEVILHQSQKRTQIHPHNQVINQGDHLILSKSHEFLKRGEHQIIDHMQT